MGVTEGERDYAALDNADWFANLVGSGLELQKPEGVFPRLELPEAEAG